MHEVLDAQAALRFQVEDLREWRASARKDFERFGERCDDLADQINRVLKSDEIAEAVANKMSQQNTLRLTTVQRLAALTVGVAGLAASLKVLVGA